MPLIRSLTAYLLSLLVLLPVAGSELSFHYCCGELYSIEWGRAADSCSTEDQASISGSGVVCCTFATLAIQESGTSSENRKVSVISSNFFPAQAIAQPLNMRTYWASPDLSFPSFFSYPLTPALPIWLLVRVLRL